MKPSRQNLCLFLEENDLEYVIDSKPVHLFMNRSVVNEEDQFEIIGVYYLQKVEKELKRKRMTEMYFPRL